MSQAEHTHDIDLTQISRLAALREQTNSSLVRLETLLEQQVERHEAAKEQALKLFNTADPQEIERLIEAKKTAFGQMYESMERSAVVISSLLDAVEKGVAPTAAQIEALEQCWRGLGADQGHTKAVETKAGAATEASTPAAEARKSATAPVTQANGQQNSSFDTQDIDRVERRRANPATPQVTPLHLASGDAGLKDGVLVGKPNRLLHGDAKQPLPSAAEAAPEPAPAAIAPELVPTPQARRRTL